MLATIKNETRLNALKKTLKKADLGYIDGFIVIRDEKRWTAVPIRPRIPMRMPTTRNWLEALHRHLNESVGRCNSFWRSLAIIVAAIAKKTLHFPQAALHDFRTAIMRSKSRVKRIPLEQLTNECDFFGSSADDCSRGETIHLSACHGTHLSCHHRYSLWAEKPQFPETFHLDVVAQRHDLEYEQVVHEHAQRLISSDNVTWLKH